MKSMAEIKTTPRLLILREGSDGGWAEAHLASSKKSTPAMVVMKDSLRELMGDDFRQEFPWEDE